jgi:hypothetical protein
MYSSKGFSAALVSAAIPSAITAMTILASTAAAKDVLFVVLEEDDGTRSAHHQLSSNCSEFLEGFRKATKDGSPVTLTFQAPPKVTGRVLEAYCILPDGSIHEGQ